MAVAQYVTQIDWNNDGDFDDVGETITANHVLFINIKRGKKGRLSHATPGTLEIRLKNDDGRYTPANASSPLYGSVKVGRPIRIAAIYSAVTYYLFHGFITKITPNVHPTHQDCYIYATDGTQFLERAELTIDLQEDAATGTLIGTILDAANWDATMRDLDTGQDTIPYAWWDEVMALEAIHEIEKTERGYFYFDGRGYATWKDRSFRNYQTSQATFIDAQIQDSGYDLDVSQVVNDAKVTFTEREETDVITLWEQTWTGASRPVVQPQETYTFVAEYGGLGKDVVTPDNGVDSDWHWVDIDGDNALFFTLTFTRYSESAKVEIKNDKNYAVSLLEHFRIRGKLIRDLDTVVRTAKDSTSQTAYGIKSYSYDGRLLPSLEATEDYAGWLCMPDPQPLISRLHIMNRDATDIVQVLDRDLSDRITVNSTLMCINEDYFINALEHRISEGGKKHDVYWDLARVAEEEFASVDNAKVDSARVAY